MFNYDSCICFDILSRECVLSDSLISGFVVMGAEITDVVDNNHFAKCHRFLLIADSFKLGKLVTEDSHPDTANLSDLAKNNPSEAVAVINKIDQDALAVVATKIPQLTALSKDILETLESGGRIFIYGCGATGRLSLTLETLWRMTNLPEDRYKESVISFMTGGDAALIRSIEKHEDLPELAANHLESLGFREGDLAICCTEGGETPSVIGVTNKAAELSSRKPYFLYCNPDEILVDNVERSREVILNTNINKINLTTGPQALSGSTRMQASTVLLAGVGSALFSCFDNSQVGSCLQEVIDLVKRTDFSQLVPLIKKESEIYHGGEKIYYITSPQYAITVLTDTTERSPTFSLIPFENVLDQDGRSSWAYLIMPGASNARDAWEKLLHRKIRPLTIGLTIGPSLDLTGMERILGFDISPNIIPIRHKLNGGAQNHEFHITEAEGILKLQLGNTELSAETGNASLLAKHLLLKLLLNTHSTLVMGRMDRYEGNVMTWVKPSNNKLIDRAIRYASTLFRRHLGGDDSKFDYSDVAYALFEASEDLQPDESIVLKTFNRLKKWWQSQ